MVKGNMKNIRSKIIHLKTKNQMFQKILKKAENQIFFGLNGIESHQLLEKLKYLKQQFLCIKKSSKHKS